MSTTLVHELEEDHVDELQLRSLRSFHLDPNLTSTEPGTTMTWSKNWTNLQKICSSSSRAFELGVAAAARALCLKSVKRLVQWSCL